MREEPKEIQLTVNDLHFFQEEFKPGQKLFASFIDSTGKLQRRSIYKYVEDAEETEVCFYLGDDKCS